MMTNLLKAAHREEGQNWVEYTLVLGASSFVAILGLNAVGMAVGRVFGALASRLDAVL
jgi:Flp pilus assembly pilin Flp